jgi:hypothetical protein
MKQLKGRIMKTILKILLLAMVLIWGCDTTSDITINTPEERNDNTPEPLFLNVNCELIPLPNKSPLWEDSIFSISQEIDGAVGGRILLEKYYISDIGDSIAISSDLYITAGAFEGLKTISMTVDDNYAIIHFSPEMVFADTLRLFQHFEGLELDQYPTGTIDFCFVGENGKIEIIKKNGLQIIVPQGIVRVQNAKLLHFSRYGWIRKTVAEG